MASSCVGKHHRMTKSQSVFDTFFCSSCDCDCDCDERQVFAAVAGSSLTSFGTFINIIIIAIIIINIKYCYCRLSLAIFPFYLLFMSSSYAIWVFSEFSHDGDT